ncbi:MAG: NADH:flavin oxidoreductase [Desulfobacterales bacterium]|nr:NADH:flavin oxidoreductase [Desulfobacterales bacterium]
MPTLFEPVKIREMAVPNRFVRSATYDGCADTSGHVTGAQVALFEQLAAGGSGLIVTGIAYVHDSGRISAYQNSIADDNAIDGLKRLTDAVHDKGARIAVQLFHAGREAAGFLKTKNRQAAGPSVVAGDPYFQRPYRAMTEDEIYEIIAAFGDSAERARKAGFDAVQLHAAHAYLPAQFLSPHANRRQDDWGGSLENRLRLHSEIYGNIREKVGQDYPVLAKLGVADGFDGGLVFDEGKQAAQLLARWGFDGLEISSGLRGKRYSETEFKTGISRPEKEAYFRQWCRQIRDLVDVPVMMVGGLRSPDLMAEIVANHEADMISLSRPLIREPDIIRAWQSGDRKAPDCISCNKCLEALYKGQQLHCAQQKSRAEG